MKKTQIYILTLSALKNDKHMAITAFMAEALKMFSIADTKLAIFVAAYMEAYQNEEKAFMRIGRKELTAKVNEADAERINCLRIIRDSQRIFMMMKNEQKKAAAQRIFDAIELYGGAAIYTQPIDSRTGNISNIIEDLEADLADAVTTLEIGPAVESLAEANEQFLKAQSERALADAEYGKSVMAEARVETDKIWRAVVEEVNNAIAYGTDEEREALVPFARYMNVEIDKYRIQTGQGVGGSTSSGSSSETDGTDTVRSKTATFKFVGGRSESYPVEVGTVLIAPSNTEGYRWKPEVPEFMPDTNKTFREVPIDAEEATATFHFFDHREEEIKQVVGSALTAPENTAGYYWEPEVPSVMPAEDTSYYELPEEQGEQFTALFTFHGGRTEEITAAAGATLTAPQNTEGYMWQPAVPAVMPAENTSYTEVEDNRQEYQITYMDVNNEDEFDIQMVKEGDPITPPTPPTGYHWVDVPEVMPARNIYIRCAANA